MLDPFLGEICAFPFDFAPKGWHFCNGKSLSISGNTALYSILGDRFNNTQTGSGEFGLPNLAGAAQIGFDLRAAQPMGRRSGADDVTLIGPNLPAHSHVLQYRDSSSEADKTAAPSPTSALSPVAQVTRGGMVDPTPAFIIGGTPGTPFASEAIGPNVGDSPHENRQPYIVLNYCIAIDGEYPSR